MNTYNAAQMAHKLLEVHGLAADGWTFRFDKAVRRFGCCHYGLKRITLSEKLTAANSKDRVRQTLLHEIAHALTPMAQPHGREWLKKARAIGYTGGRAYSSEVVKPAADKVGTCPNCHRVIHRMRRQKLACTVCCNRFNGGRYDSRYLFTWI